MIALARAATESFQCCEAKGKDERCKKCDKLCDSVLKQMADEVPLAEVGERGVLSVAGQEYRRVNLSERFAGGGFSIVFASSDDTPVPKRGQTRLEALSAQHESKRGIVIKACDATDVDMCRPQLIEAVIAQHLHTHAPQSRAYLLAPIGELFKLPMPHLEPEYLYATAYPRCDGDLLELLSAEMLSEEHLFYVYSAIAVTLHDLQEKLRFSHGDLKFENIFFRYSPPLSRELSHGGLFATFHDIYFTPIIADFGMSAITLRDKGNTYLGTDFWGRDRAKTLVRGADMCFLTMCLLSVEGRELRKHSRRFHSFLWSLCNSCETVAEGIRAMRDGEGDHLCSDSEGESDDEAMRNAMKKARISTDNYDRAMYIISNSSTVDMRAFEPLQVFEGIVGLRMLD